MLPTPSRAFENAGVDFTGPFEYKIAKGEFGKACLALSTCAASRAVYLDLVKNMEVDTFKRCLKEFIARRGNPKLMISNNAKTFKATAKWLKDLQQNVDINAMLAKLQVEWIFNLSRTPCWGGFFERMIGLTKNVLQKLFE